MQEHFTSKFEAPPSEGEKHIIGDLAAAFRCHGTPYNLKMVPEATSKNSSARTVQADHLDFIAKQFRGQVATEQINEDGIDKATRRTLKDIGLTGGVANPGSFPEAYVHTGQWSMSARRALS